LRSIQPSIDLTLHTLLLIVHAAPYVEMVILIKVRNATHLTLILFIVQSHAIVCRDINEILNMIGEKLSLPFTSHAPNFVETLNMIRMKSARLVMIIAHFPVNARWAMR